MMAGGVRMQAIQILRRGDFHAVVRSHDIAGRGAGLSAVVDPCPLTVVDFVSHFRHYSFVLHDLLF